MEQENKPKRFRRTKASIEQAINKAAKDLILKKGFVGVTVLDIIKKAKIEPITFYNRYKNQEEFYDNFVREFDYWFNDTLKIPAELYETEERYVQIIHKLIDATADDSVMMELLRWEICDTNAVTRRTAMNREFHTLPLIKPYEIQFRNSGVDIKAVTTLLIAGVYYLNLHRRCSPFCEIDVNKEEGRETIKTTIKSLINLLYQHRENKIRYEYKLKAISERMRERGVKEEDIDYFLFGNLQNCETE